MWGTVLLGKGSLLGTDCLKCRGRSLSTLAELSLGDITTFILQGTEEEVSGECLEQALNETSVG